MLNGFKLGNKCNSLFGDNAVVKLIKILQKFRNEFVKRFTKIVELVYKLLLN